MSAHPPNKMLTRDARSSSWQILSLDYTVQLTDLQHGLNYSSQFIIGRFHEGTP